MPDKAVMLKRWAKSIGLHNSKPLYHLYHRYFCRDPHPLNMPNRDVVLSTDSQKFLVPNPHRSHIGSAIFYHGVWEPEATAFVSPRVKPGMIVLDVGANGGYYTVLFAKRVGSTGRVIAFEPEPVGVQFIRRNVELNRYDNVTVMPVALSNTNGKAAAMANTFVPDNAAAPASDKTFTLRVFDDLLNELNVTRVDLAKIDVEGTELHVLEGMDKTLRTWSPDLLLEVHPASIERCGRSEQQLLQFLADRGYRTVPVQEASPSGVYTIYCTPAAKPAEQPQPETLCQIT